MTPARRTKIVATIGPASDTPERLAALAAEGVDVFRISASHDPIEVVVARIHAARAAASSVGIDVAVMVDLSGPKLRCTLPSARTSVLAGESWRIVSGASIGTERELGTTVPSHVWETMPLGTRLAIGDGALQFEVLSVDAGGATCRAESSAELRGRPGLHVPSKLLELAVPTLDDRLMIEAAVEADVDAIAVSFVQKAEDVIEVKRLAPEQFIVAKIETTAAVHNLDGIISAADAVMVARGDLGLEFSLAEIPFLQRQIIYASTAAARPVITATQMLESMVASQVPTRAEAADVATAVLDGTSAVMLSGETAIGADPLATVRVMNVLAARADREVLLRADLPLPKTGDSTTALITHSVSESAHRVAAQTGAVAVVGLTDSGFTARALSRWRSPLPLIAATRSPRTLRQLRFAWGVTAVQVSSADDDGVLAELVGSGILPSGVPVVVVSGIPGSRASDTIRVCLTPPSL